MPLNTSNRNNVSQPAAHVISSDNGAQIAEVLQSPPVVGTDWALAVYANLGSEVIAVQQNTDGASQWDTAQVALNSSTATLVLAANATRRSAIVSNMSATINIFVGPSTVTAANGQIIPPGSSLTIPITAAIYAISASSTPSVSVAEAFN